MELNDDVKQEKTLLQIIFYYIGVILNYKLMIIIVSIIGTLAGLGLAVVSLKLPADINPLPNTYTAGAILVIEETGASSSEFSMLQSFGMEGIGSVSNFSMIVQNILMSRNFLNAISESVGLPEMERFVESDPQHLREFIAGQLHYSFNNRSGALSLTFSDTDPQLAADIINTTIDRLKIWYEEEGGSRSAVQLQEMKETMSNVEEIINKLDTDILLFQQKYGVLNVAEISDAQNQLINELQSSLIDIELQLKNYSSFSKFEDPELIRLREEKSNVLTMISELENGIYAGTKKFPKKSELPGLALQLAHMQGQRSLQQNIYSRISQDYEVARQMAVSEVPFFILQDAEVPTEKTGPKRSIICIGAAFGSFFGSIMLALFLHIIKSVSKNAELVKLLKGSSRES